MNKRPLEKDVWSTYVFRVERTGGWVGVLLSQMKELFECFSKVHIENRVNYGVERRVDVSKPGDGIDQFFARLTARAEWDNDILHEGEDKNGARFYGFLYKKYGHYVCYKQLPLGKRAASTRQRLP